MPIELAIIVPTFQERENIEPLLARLRAVLEGVDFEVVFVDDDSPDGTAEAVRQIGQGDRAVRVLHRIRRRGLASACLEGMLSTSAPYLAVIDADLQHDESILPKMLDCMRTGKYDLVIGSRHTHGGGMGGFSKERVALSNLGLQVSRLISRHELSDPMSGYFMLTRGFLEEVMRRTTSVGFKVLLDLVASAPRPVRFVEIPYVFRERERGQSKLDVNVGLEYLYLVIDKLVGRWLPLRFVLFCMVGLAGLFLHLTILWILYRRWGVNFEAAMATAIGLAMLGNFSVNNLLTYRDRRRRGRSLLTGILMYTMACSVGNLSNYAIARFLIDKGIWWPVCGLCGVAVGSVWNFGANSVLTWRLGVRGGAGQ